MCGVCGCGEGEVRIEPEHSHEHHQQEAIREDPSERSHLVRVEQDILAKNDALAGHNRAHFRNHRVLALNLVSSPGAGKTTLLVRTLEALLPETTAAVIEGDQETTADADRIRETGAPAVQVNTGKGCHLDAQMIDSAFNRLHFSDGILFIENVGNLVCPAGFDLGEAHKVVIASVTEGEDKPLKYPNMFAASSLMLVSKVDLLPHLDFDVDALIANARRVNPAIAVIQVSAKDATGMDSWLQWLAGARGMMAATA
ncbi:hydrogenase nickel incorporation protein HypB [Pseudohalioglobus sediminis]|uniref:Hydrogenase maturation factor HypB n=1 Tax=Pseudohalioglobus sediminis TaxID=2606449 RepID=A0A5B0WT84_9GAMM|nr:hydrogenase nickel incorporation protein HypB [Pseudohalioglobus sediminis]KAA1189678.1 hydrogenase nickel incorporation protein HypB [Pseudohalioglobus sediminis]